MLVCPGSSEVKAIQMLLRKFYPKSSFVPTTAEKDLKKNNEKNKSFILLQQTSVNYSISWYIAMRFIYVSFILLWLCSQLFLFLINLPILLFNFNKRDYSFIKILFFLLYNNYTK